MPWSPFLESPRNCSCPETCFVFVVFAFKMKGGLKGGGRGRWGL